jgi:signal transduction histidine kinase
MALIIRQEFPMQSELIPQVLNLKAGDHLCLFYEKDPAEQMTALIPFIQDGLSKNEQCLYVADDQTVDELSERLRHGGVNVRQETGRGRLKLLTRDDWRQPGKLDSRSKSIQVRQLVKEASKAGFHGIRFAVEMTWILGPDFTPAELEHWEATINTLTVPGFPGRVICQYNRSRLSPEVIMAALHTHPLAVFGEKIYPNFFYQAPLILNKKHKDHIPAAAKVEWIIEQLKRARSAEDERVAMLKKRAEMAGKLEAEIIERKRLEHEVARVGEREQLRLGQELHDGIGQHFTGIAYQMSALHGSLAEISSPLAPQALKLENLIRDGVKQARELAHGFYPVGLENRGLTTALEDLANKTRRMYGLLCIVKSDGAGCDKLPSTTALELFRIAQEAVANSAKHAKAKRIVIGLSRVGRKVTLVIKDDGVGLPVFKDSSSTGIGLRIMKHRAQLIGGELDCRNHKNGGAMITCTVTVKQGLLAIRKPPLVQTVNQCCESSVTA